MYRLKGNKYSHHYGAPSLGIPSNAGVGVGDLPAMGFDENLILTFFVVRFGWCLFNTIEIITSCNLCNFGVQTKTICECFII